MEATKSVTNPYDVYKAACNCAIPIDASVTFVNDAEVRRALLIASAGSVPTGLHISVTRAFETSKVSIQRHSTRCTLLRRWLAAAVYHLL